MAGENLNGVRLADIYGFNENDYNTFYNTNMDTFKSYSATTGQSVFNVARNKYINDLIRNNMGVDTYKEKASGLSFDDKVRLYNEFAKQREEQESNQRKENILGETLGEKMNNIFGGGMNVDTKLSQQVHDSMKRENIEANVDVYNAYRSGNLQPSKVPTGGPIRYSPSGSPETGVKTYRDWFSENANMAHLNNVYETDVDRQVDIFNGIYDKNYKRFKPENANTASAINDVKNYKNVILDDMNKSPRLAYNMFVEFENNTLNRLNDYKNYKGTNKLTFTPNDMKDIMAEYYSRVIIQGDNIANEWIYYKLNDNIYKNMGVGKKIANVLPGGGANVAGMTISAIPIIFNVATGNVIPRLLGQKIEDESISGIEKYLMTAGNNAWAKYGLRMIETGMVTPSSQEWAKSNGYNRYGIYKKAGEETNFLTFDSMLEMLQQQGFTIASMFTGGLMAIGANAITKGTTRLALKMAGQQASKFARLSTKALDAVMKINSVTFPTMVLAGNEALLDGFNIAELSGQKMNDYIYNLMLDNGGMTKKSFIDEYIDKKIDPQEFEDFYEKHRDKSIAIPNELGGESIESVNDRLRLEREVIYNQYRRLVADRLAQNPEIVSMIEDTKLRAASRNIAQETMLIMATDIFFSNILGPSMKYLKRGAAKAILGRAVADGSNAIVRRGKDGLLRAYANKMTAGDILGKVAITSFEPLSEGVQEGGQNVSVKLNEYLSDNYAAMYMLNQGNEEAIRELSDRYWDNIDTANKVIGREVFSEEGVYSFLMGAVSAGLGVPTFGRGLWRHHKKYMAGQRQYNNYFRDLLNDFGQNWYTEYYRNPYIESIHEGKLNAVKSAKEAEDINKWLENHKDVQAMNDLRQFYAWYIKASDSANGSEADFNDAYMGARIAGLMMMDRLDTKILGKSSMKRLEQLASVTTADKNVKAQLIDEIRKAQNVADDEVWSEQKENEELKRVESEAKKTLSELKTIKRERENLDMLYGDNLSDNTKDAWAFSAAMSDTWEDSIKNTMTRIRNVYNSSNPKFRAAESVAEELSAIARYGSKQNARLTLADRENKLETLNGNRKKIGRARYKAAKRRIEAEIELIKKDIEVMDKLDDNVVTIVTSDQMLGLSPKDLWRMLDPKNAKLYSKEQRAEIDAFRKTQGVNDALIADIEAAAVFQKRMEEYKLDRDEFMKNNDNMYLFDQEIRDEVARKIMSIRLERAKRAATYEAFEEEMKKVEDEILTVDEKNAMRDILINNKFYATWVKNNKIRERDNDIMSNSSVFNEMNPYEKRLFSLAYDKALRDGDTSYNHIVDILNDSTFRENVKSQYGIDTDIIVDNDRMRSVLEQINNVRSNVEALEEYQKKIETRQKENDTKEEYERKRKEAEEEKKKQGEKPSNMFDRKTYKENQQLYDSLIGSDAFIEYIHSGKIIKEGFTFKTLVDFIQLIYGDSGIDFSDNIFDAEVLKKLGGKFNMRSLIEARNILANKFNEYTENNKTDSNNADAVRKLGNSSKLIGAITGIITSFRRDEDGFRTKIYNNLKELVEDGGNKELSDKLAANKPEESKRVLTRRKFDIMEAESMPDFMRKYYEVNLKSNLDWLIGMATAGKISLPESDVIFIDAASDGLVMPDDFSVTNDNRPIIIAVSVEEGTNGAKDYLGNGIYYLPIGFMQNSRANASYNENDMNVIRDRAESGENANGKVVTDKNKKVIYGKKGLYITAEKKLISLNNVSIEEFAKSKGLTADEFINKLLDNNDNSFRIVKFGYARKDANSPVEIDKNKSSELVGDKNRFDDITEKHMKDMLGKSNSRICVYIADENNKLYQIFPKEADSVPVIDGNKNHSDIREVLSSAINTQNGYDGIKGLAHPVISVINKIVSAFNGINKVEDLKLLKEEIQNAIDIAVNSDLYINVGYKITKDFKIELTKNNDLIISFTANDSNNTNISVTIPGSELFNNDSSINADVLQRSIISFVRDMVFNTIDGKQVLRVNSNGTPMFKVQTNYGFMTDPSYEDYTRSLFENDRVTIDEVNKEEVKVSVNNGQKKIEIDNGKSNNSITAAIEALNDYIKTERSREIGHQAGAIGVTSLIADHIFISDDEDAAMASKIATTIGTSIDRFQRQFIHELMEYRKTHSDINEKVMLEEILRNIQQWVIDNSKALGVQNNFQRFPGMSESVMESFAAHFYNVIKKIEANGEKILDNEYYFPSTKLRLENGNVVNASMSPDLITVDLNGEYHIYDFKTFNTIKTSNEKIKLTDQYGIGMFLTGARQETVNKWEDQLSLYKIIIETVTGRKVAGLHIIPNALFYDSRGYSTVPSSEGTLEFIGDGMVDFYKDSKDLRGNKKKVYISTNSYNDTAHPSKIYINFPTFAGKRLDEIEIDKSKIQRESPTQGAIEDFHNKGVKIEGGEAEGKPLNDGDNGPTGTIDSQSVESKIDNIECGVKASSGTKVPEPKLIGRKSGKKSNLQ